MLTKGKQYADVRSLGKKANELGMLLVSSTKPA
jgi:hypothetical protein